MTNEPWVWTHFGNDGTFIFQVRRSELTHMYTLRTWESKCNIHWHGQHGLIVSQDGNHVYAMFTRVEE
jgi:hypothetical protein